MDVSQLGSIVSEVEGALSKGQQPPDAGVTMAKRQPVQAITRAVPVPVVTAGGDDVVGDAAPTEVKKSWLWITDDKGKGNIPVTLLFVAFWTTTFAYVASMFERVGPFSMRAFDTGACMAYLGSVIALYLGHHGVEAWKSTQQ